MLWITENIEALDPEAVLRFLPVITEARRARVLAMTHAPTQIRSILAELLLRRALREEYDLRDLPRMVTGKKGKPFFPDRPELHFSLSHCKTAIACALAPAPVGVDVQEVRPLRRAARPLAAASDDTAPRMDSTLPSAHQNLPLEGKVTAPEALTDEVAPQARKLPSVYRILSEQERAWVEAGENPAEQDRRFTAVWTCKEAWGKALGVGFLYDLRSSRFLPETETWTQYGWIFAHLSHSDYELTLCAHEPLPRKSVSFEEIINEVTL